MTPKVLVVPVAYNEKIKLSNVKMPCSFDVGR